ncbi:MAG: alpha/beta hydrolase [Gammaproteobacteria bacterium]
MTIMLNRLLLATLLCLLAGCTTFHTEAPRLTKQNGSQLKATRYQAEVVAEDGTKIRMTVWQPALDLTKGETAPLLIHAHGFGLSRMKRPLSLYGQLLPTGEAAVRAWRRGYWVISYDQRGHGASEGDIGLIRRDKEGRDVSRIIDWASRYLQLDYEDNDPVVGMIGESYGGGAQLMAATVDKRIDALVPVTTWYDLEHALLPNRVPKTDWILVLAAAGYTMNPTHMSMNVSTGMMKEMFAKGDPYLRRQLRENSLVNQCGKDGAPYADALLLQGFRDVLFSFDQAEATRKCFLDAGRDVRLIGIQDGHLNPSSQWSPGMPVWHMQNNVTCNGQSLKTDDIIDHWLDGKLRYDAAALAQVPTYCVTGDTATDALAAAGNTELHWQTLPATRMGSGMNGFFELVLKPLDHVANWFVPARLPADWQQPRHGWLRPGRIPLMTTDNTRWVAGTPVIRVNLQNANKPGNVVFLRMAKWRPGSGSYEVLHQQVMPVRAGRGAQEVRLPAIRTQLQPGEVLGLLVQGYSNQFRMAGQRFGTSATVAGTIGLPDTAVTTRNVAAQGAPGDQTPSLP